MNMWSVMTTPTKPEDKKFGMSISRRIRSCWGKGIECRILSAMLFLWRRAGLGWAEPGKRFIFVLKSVIMIIIFRLKEGEYA